MICSECLIQMHQKDKLGYGYSRDGFYLTIEVKECPGCKKLVEEGYWAEVIDKKGLKWRKD